MRTFSNLGIERLTAVITILTVAGVAMSVFFNQEMPNYPRILLALWLFTVFLGLEILLSREMSPEVDGKFLLLDFLQFSTVVAIFFTVPMTFMGILLCIWCGNLMRYMSLRRAVYVTPVYLLVFYGVYRWYWGYEHMMYSAPLYGMLCLFTLVMISSWVRENEAREASQQLNRELLAAQSLLKEATKQSERIRIARDIHDLVGHHLTALTINLQVAMHKSQGEAKEQVEKSFAIAKLLLADVREAVTEIREKSDIDLRQSLEALISTIPRLKVTLELQQNLAITNVELADTLLKCVQESLTNSLKHSQSDKFTIVIFRDRNELVLEMSDSMRHVDAQLPATGNSTSFGFKSVSPGNGLNGIRERIAMFGGEVRFESRSDGFCTFISIPEVA